MCEALQEHRDEPLSHARLLAAEVQDALELAVALRVERVNSWARAAAPRALEERV